MGTMAIHLTSWLVVHQLHKHVAKALGFFINTLLEEQQQQKQKQTRVPQGSIEISLLCKLDFKRTGS